MAKRCSHCNHDGHNSRTCPNRGVRLFGVRITDGSMRKSASTGNLAVLERSAGGGGGGGGGSPLTDLPDPFPACFRGSGYASDSLHGSSGSRERKKGSPWTEHEHRMFLLGLKKLGKGNWRGIAHNYVMSRTPTQVASHAQKYFIRHSATNRRKRRVSLFDIVADQPTPTENLPSSSQEQETPDSSLLPVSQISDEQADMEMDYSTIEVDETVSAPPTTAPPAAMKYNYLPPVYPVFIPLTVPQASNDHVGMKYNTTGEVEGVVTAPPTTMQFSYTPTYPGFFSPGLPCPMLYWPACTAQAAVPLSKIVKPMAVHSKTPIDVNELCGMSRLSLVTCDGEAGPLTPAPKIPGSSEKQTAFHGSASTGGSSLDSSSSPIHAI